MSRRMSSKTKMKVIFVLLLTTVTSVLFLFPKAARSQDHQAFAALDRESLSPGYEPSRAGDGSPVRPVRSIGELLRPDGSINLATEFRGTVDTNGYRMVSGPGEAPRFQPLSAAGDERWADSFAAPGMDDLVTALVVDGSGNLYAGGQFTEAGGVTANYIAKWNGTSWQPLSSGMNNYVDALAVDGSGSLYAGGALLRQEASQQTTLPSGTAPPGSHWEVG
jgi:hypothetical protein